MLIPLNQKMLIACLKVLILRTARYQLTIDIHIQKINLFNEII